jgi:hypothetical protein
MFSLEVTVLGAVELNGSQKLKLFELVPELWNGHLGTGILRLEM